jgi:hypothetical protein
MSVQCAFPITAIRYQALSALVPTNATSLLGLDPDTIGSTSLEDSSPTSRLQATLPASTSDCILGENLLGKSPRSHVAGLLRSPTDRPLRRQSFAKDKFDRGRVRRQGTRR